METTTFKCEHCEWIGSTPKRFNVGSGLSSWPVRYLCPECPKIGKYSSLEVCHIVPRAEYYTITDAGYLFENYHLAFLLNCPVGLENTMISDERLKYLEKLSEDDPEEVERWYRKSDVDAFIKSVHESNNCATV